MNPKLKIQTSDIGCRKPGCKHRLSIPQRHHRRCDTAFLGAFAKTLTKTTSKDYIRLTKRYDAFRPEDIIILCGRHHCEIHLIYDGIIQSHQHRLRRPLQEYTWRQANNLMSKLESRCKKWEKNDTPGRDEEDCDPKKRFPWRYRRREP